MREFVREVLRGVAIGVANVIPGVSGGTMMVSMGIYPNVIGAVTGVFSDWRRSVRILFPYAAGMGIGVICFSFLAEYFFETFPLQTALLFLGLILGGIPLLLPKVSGARPNAAEAALFLIFFALILWTQSFGAGESGEFSSGLTMGTAKLFGVGALAAATMVIPGVSGSMILMALGYYMPVLGCINTFLTSVAALDWNTTAECLWVLAPFGAGVVLGIFGIAKVVEYFLGRWERLSYFAILGLVAASPVAVFGPLTMERGGIADILTGAALFLVGIFLSARLGT